MSSGRRFLPPRQMWRLVREVERRGIEGTGYRKREKNIFGKEDRGRGQLSDVAVRLHILSWLGENEKHSWDVLGGSSSGGGPEQGPPVNPWFIDSRCSGG